MFLHPWPILDRQAPPRWHVIRESETADVSVGFDAQLSCGRGAVVSGQKGWVRGERGKKRSPARLYGEALKGGWRSLGVDDREKVGHCCLPFCRYVRDLLERIRARFTRLSSYAKNPQPHQTIVVVQNTQKKKAFDGRRRRSRSLSQPAKHALPKNKVFVTVWGCH